jgi:hypothetical protein
LQAIGIILLLISIGTVVGPIGAVVIIYRDNLVQLVVPPQITDILNGNSTIFQGNAAQIDIASRTFTVTVNFTDTFIFDLTLNNVSAEAVCAQHNYPLGNISFNGVILISTGETAQIPVSGLWTQDAENHILTEHPDATSVDVNLVNLTINVNGIVIQQSEPVSVGSIPLT